MSNEPKKAQKVKLNWEEHYQTTPMEALHWYSVETDPEVYDAIRKYCPKKGEVLDLGTGPGTMAIEFTKMGYSVTATDIARAAIDMAAKRAGDIARKICFLVDDITDSNIKAKFDIIHDRGCFHVMSAENIPKYLENILKLLKNGGILLLKTFSVKETRQDGPNRYSPEMIKDIFGADFEILHTEETIYPSTLDKDPMALFCVLKKRPV